MEELKKFITDNRTAFEQETLPSEHRTRFTRGVRRARYRIVLTKATGIAAALAILFGASFFIRTMSPDPSNEIEEQIALYGISATEISNQIIALSKSNGADTEEIKLIIEQVHNDAIPILQQLPEELSSGEKAYILKRYYNQKLKALRQIYAQVEIINE